MYEISLILMLKRHFTMRFTMISGGKEEADKGGRRGDMGNQGAPVSFRSASSIRTMT
jgi:hypothetical protein